MADGSQAAINLQQSSALCTHLQSCMLLLVQPSPPHPTHHLVSVSVGKSGRPIALPLGVLCGFPSSHSPACCFKQPGIACVRLGTLLRQLAAMKHVAYVDHLAPACQPQLWHAGKLAGVHCRAVQFGGAQQQQSACCMNNSQSLVWCLCHCLLLGHWWCCSLHRQCSGRSTMQLEVAHSGLLAQQSSGQQELLL
jgi:hypothetical protein